MKRILIVVLLGFTTIFSLTGCDEETVYEVTEEDILLLENTVSEIDGLYIGLLDGNSMTNSTNVEIKSNVITIKSGGDYTLTGSLNDGQVIIDTGDYVGLTFDSVDITNEYGSAIYIEDADGGVVITLVDGTSNTLSDGSSHTDQEITGVLYSKDDLTLQGTGTLIVHANYKDGIVSKDNLTVEDGVYVINSTGDAIYGKDTLLIDGGDFSIVTGEGSASAPIQEEIMGGGGRPGMPTPTVPVVDEEDEGSLKGLKTQGILTINNGTFEIDTYEDAIHSDTEIEINGGTFNILSGDDAIHADSLLTINGGIINIGYSAEGLESFSVIINSGTIRISAYDDGINATNGTNTSVGGPADHPDNGDYDLESDPHIIINDGTVFIDSDGDGIDANGVVLFNGGMVTVNGKGNSAGIIESPIDFDITGVVNGGTIIALGTSTMAYEFDDVKSTQNSFNVTFDIFYSIGTTIEILDTDGNILATMSSTNTFETLIFSSENLIQGETYILSIGNDNYSITLSEDSTASLFHS